MKDVDRDGESEKSLALTDRIAKHNHLNLPDEGEVRVIKNPTISDEVFTTMNRKLKLEN